MTDKTLTRKAKCISTEVQSGLGQDNLYGMACTMRFKYSSPALLLLLCLSVLLLLSSCGSVQDPEFRNVDNIRFGGFGRSSSTVTMNVHYYNPNNMRLKLKEAKGKAWLDDQYLGDFKMDTLIHIPARGEFILPVSLELKPDQLLKNSLLTFLNKEVVVKMEGKAKVGKGIFFISYPIKYEGKQDLKKYMK